MRTNRHIIRRSLIFVACCAVTSTFPAMCHADESTENRSYDNRLEVIGDPQPILADHPEWVQPIREAVHYEASALVDDENADLSEAKDSKCGCNTTGAKSTRPSIAVHMLALIF